MFLLESRSLACFEKRTVVCLSFKTSAKDISDSFAVLFTLPELKYRSVTCSIVEN
jgi:hypothetical protein